MTDAPIDLEYTYDAPPIRHILSQSDMDELKAQAAPALTGAQLFTPHLSPLQRRLLPYLAAGWSSKQIANELHLAERTVRDQTCRILYALALSNRTQVGMWAVVTRQVDIEHVRGLLLQQAPHLERVVQP